MERLSHMNDTLLSKLLRLTVRVQSSPTPAVCTGNMYYRCIGLCRAVLPDVYNLFASPG